ncbi:MAG TPA: DNA internalization-related competence protein ComEC/Rec2 [Clostridiales bacterium]|nr:DNA internalization-related competence protein ComEC/Rec2 [Clostridiales bacterium]
MRKLAVFAFSFSAAIFLAKYALPPEWLLIAAALFAAIGLLALLLNGDVRLRAMLIAFGFVAGFLWNYAYYKVIYKPYEYLDGETTVIKAEVLDYPQATERGFSLYAKIKQEKSPLGIRILLYADDITPALSPGDVIELSARLFKSSVSYGEETDYYTSKGVFLIAYQRGEISVTRAEKLPLKHYPQYLSKVLNEKISEIFEGDTAPFILALLTGDRTLLNKDSRLTSAMSSAGTSHVVAVSGMHVSFLVGLIMTLMRRKRMGAVICIPIILVFMAMVGNTPSVVRAGVMQILLLAAPLVRRESDHATSLAAALMLLLLINPYSAGNVGLQLSFAAMGGIVLFSGRINAFFSSSLEKKLFKNPLFRAVWSFTAATLSSTLGALVFTTPLIALHFKYVSLISPLANLLTLWSVSFAFCGGLISVIFGFIFTPLGKIAAWLVSWLVRYNTDLVLWLSKFRFASLSMLSLFTRLWLVFVYLLLGWLIINRKRKPRLIIPLCSVIITLCLSILLSGYFVDRTNMTVTAVDVGQGQSIVITTKEHTFVVDCGGNGASNPGILTTQFLRSINRSSIDLLVITHFHSDHANGITRLMEQTDVKLLAMPYIDDSFKSDEDYQYYYTQIRELAEKRDIEVLYVTQNLQLANGETSIRLYAPIGGNTENEKGVVAMFSVGENDVLITGDITSALERRFIKLFELPDIEVLVAGHHGSKYSTSKELLDALTPENVIISVGYNTYGHPAEELLGRLSERNITVLRTDILGNAAVRLK